MAPSFKPAWLLALMLAGGAAGQDEPPAESETVSSSTDPADEPVAIPLSDIALQSEELAADLRRVEALVQPNDEVESIRASGADATARLTELQRELESIRPNRVSPRMLGDHRVEWAELDAELARWREILQGRWRMLTSELEELRRTRRVWEMTRASALEASAPEEIVALVETQLERIDATASSLEARRDAVGTLLARVSQGREISSRSLARIQEVADTLRDRIWIRNAPPLWRLSDATAGDTLRDAADQAQRYWLETLKSFVASRQGQFLFLLVFFIACLSSTWATHRRLVQSWSDDPILDDARFVVSRPLSTAIAFTVVMMVFVLDNAVGPIADLVTLLAIIPVVRLGNGLIPQPGPVVLNATIVFLVLNRISALAPDGSFLQRLLLLVLSSLAFAAALAMLVRWPRNDHTHASAWWRVGSWLFGLAVALLGISILANIAGWTHLSRTLADATVEGAFAALGWTTVVRAIVALTPLAIRSRLAKVLPSLRRHEDTFLRGTSFVVSAIAFLSWGRGELRRLQLLEPFLEWLSALLSASISVGGLEISLGSVVATVFVLVATWWGARIAQFLLREEILPRVRLPAGADHSVVSVANYVIWGSGILLAAAAAGLSGTQLTVVFGALGVGIGFGLQNIVSNFVSGLILIFERPIKVGDRVQTTDHFGIVTAIGIRASTIRTFDGAEVVVPNSDLVSKEFVNWTRTDMTRRVEVLVHVALGSDPKKVLQILRETASAHPKTLDDPEPSALMIGFGESALDFRLLAWARIDDFLEVASDLHVNVNDELRKAGIKIPHPQRDLHVNPREGEDVSPEAQLETKGTADG